MNQGLARRTVLRGLVSGAAAVGAATVIPMPARAAASIGSVFGPAPGVVRLSANENPYGPSPRALAAIAEASAKGAYYPGAGERALAERIAARHRLPVESVVITSGSSSVLQATGMIYSREGAIVLPALTFDGPLRYSERLGAELRRIPLAADMDTDLDAMERAVGDDVSLVYVCNPNNPTGVAIDTARLRNFSSRVAAKAVVLVDEAYNELTDDPDAASMVDLVRAGENVIVTRTFSKLYGLAGLRIGYALAPPALAERIRPARMSSSNAAGLAAALASYDDTEFLDYSLDKIRVGRARVMKVFADHEVPYLPSQTNFVYADIGRNANDFRAAMRERNVMVRGAYAPYDNCLRVSRGRLEGLEGFAQAFSEVYAG